MIAITQNMRSFWKVADKRLRFAMVVIVFFVIIGSLSKLLVGPNPIVWKDQTGIHTFFSDDLFMVDRNIEWQIGPLMPYSPLYIDTNASGAQAPFTSEESSFWFEHWLGTDQLGRDVFSSMIYGTRVALFVGLSAALIALFIAIVLGSAAGYYGDRDFKISWMELVCLIMMLCIWSYQLTYHIFSSFWLFMISCLLFTIIRIVDRKNRKISIPLDKIIMRSIEVMNVLPGLLLILVLLSVFQVRGMLSMSMTIALLMWPKLTQFMRAEMINAKTKNYITAVKASGMSDIFIIWRHVLPNALPPVLITAAFSISSSILLESTISFLGLGFSGVEQTWGSLLAEARTNFSAWWLVVFPGLAIFLVVMAFNILAEKLTEKWRQI